MSIASDLAQPTPNATYIYNMLLILLLLLGLITVLTSKQENVDSTWLGKADAKCFLHFLDVGHSFTSVNVLGSVIEMSIASYLAPPTPNATHIYNMLLAPLLLLGLVYFDFSSNVDST